MIITQINFIPQQEIDRRQALVKEYEHCPLCDSKMTFTHSHLKKSHIEVTVLEKSQCPSCTITIQETEYPLQ